MDEGAVPQLSGEDQGLRWLPLPGIPVYRRSGQRGPRMRSVSAPSSRGRSSGACGAAARRGEAAAVFPRSTQLAHPLLSMTDVAIRADRLTKRYGDTLAVDGVDLEIQQGQFFGLLGPNGAGKTSTIHMLSTLIRPTSGEAWVRGQSVHTQRLAVRRSIGVVFQEPALDRTLSVAENLRFAGLLNDLSRSEIRRRSVELLELFALSD